MELFSVILDDPYLPKTTPFSTFSIAVAGGRKDVKFGTWVNRVKCWPMEKRLAGIASYLAQRLQSVMNAAAELNYSKSSHDHDTPLLRQLHWLKDPRRSDFKPAVRVYKCLHPLSPAYLADELQLASNHEADQRLRSAFSSSLVVRCTLFATVGDRAFPVSAVRTWNVLPVPQHVTSTSSLSVSQSLPEDLSLLSVVPCIIVKCPRTDCCYGHFNHSLITSHYITLPT